MDPQQRLLLEVTWETLENAGINPETLRGSKTSVYVGISNNDYANITLRGAPEIIDSNTGTGNALSAAAGRLAYHFGWQGPAMAIDTACSASLVAVHQACQSLLNGESELALAAGVNLILTPELTVTFSQAQMMAPDGRCKAFDASANGYVRGEGCGAVLLKPLEAAQKDGDPIYAIIKGSAVNQDGASNGLTAPNGPSQEKVVQAALDKAQLNPELIDYVEAHGTGTSLGDPIEVKALARSLKRSSPEAPALKIGAVKSNIGHLEAAAGIAGLIKVALALKNRHLPANLHFKAPNPHVPWSEMSVEVIAKSESWKSDKPRYAGVSSFGFTGTNAHVILGSAPHSALQKNDSEVHRSFCLSAQTPDALKDAAQRLKYYFEQNTELHLDSVAQTLALGRQPMPIRASFTADSHQACLDQLSKLIGDAPWERATHANDSRICMLLTGQGSQYPEMGAAFYRHNPIFRATFDRCDSLLEPLLGESISNVLFGQKSDSIHQTRLAQPALFALEYSLLRVFDSLGIKPTALIGHSLGEVVAACWAGVFSLEDGLKLVAHRGRLMQQLPANGAMTAVFAESEIVEPLIRRYPDLAIAGLNAPGETVISGSRGAMGQILETLEKRAIRAIPLKVSHAFHSPLMLPIIEDFRSILNEIEFHAPEITVLSNLTGEPVSSNTIIQHEYWLQHVLSPVRFADSVRFCQESGYQTFLEVGPKPILTGLAKKCWGKHPAHWMQALSPMGGPLEDFSKTLSTLFEQGHAINWSDLAKVRVTPSIPLPNYPFQRQRYWVTTTPKAPEISPPKNQHPILGAEFPGQGDQPDDKIWIKRINAGEFDGYATQGRETIPTSWFVEAAHAAWGSKHETVCVCDNMKFSPPSISNDSLELQTILRVRLDGRCAVKFFSRSTPDDTWQSAAAMDIAPAPELSSTATPNLGMDFGIMFFNGTESEAPEDNYRLVLESTRFADRNGFNSVWVPERHYTEFGGLYPNPVVLLSALARETQNIRLMAGSLVMPLHHPFRVAEDWALVDNLSDGRVGLSFAPGWNPGDFAMFPGNYDHRKEILFDGLDTVRKLWRGEPVSATGGNGKDIKVCTYPRPIQQELPYWITAAGNPKSFYRAGQAGANLLTHLLDQGPEELKLKLQEYKAGRSDAGLDPEGGHISIMLHTFVGPDDDRVRKIVRAPYCAFLKENLHLLRGLAASRGTDVDIEALSDSDKDEFVGFLFERFYAERALMGTPDKCQALVDQLCKIGITEIACLLDFGVSTQDILSNLPHLNQLKTKYPQTMRRAETKEPAIEDEGVILDRLKMDMEGSRFYLQLEHRGASIPSRMKGILNLRRSDGECWAKISNSASTNAEMALQTFAAAIPDESFAQGGGRYFYPKSIGEWIENTGGNACSAHARITRSDSNSYAGDVTLLNTTGELVAYGRDIVFATEETQTVNESGQTLSDRTYAIEWRSRERDTSKQFSNEVDHWSVIGQSLSQAQHLVDALESHSVSAQRLSSGLDIPDHGVAGIVWIASKSIDRDSAEVLLKDLLETTQMLSQNSRAASIWILSENAQPIAVSDTITGLHASPLWGFGKVIALEHPQLWGGAIDIDDWETTEIHLAIQEMLQPNGEDQVAFRDSRRMISRLERAAAPEPNSIACDPDARYLVTGGMGGIGRRLARFLASRGARDLILVTLGSNKPDEGSERQTVLGELREKGIHIEVITADISDSVAVSDIFESIRELNKPLKGIFHLAGKPEIRSINETVFEEHRDILDAKIAGTWNLHQQSLTCDLDWFVCYSSISGAWGSAGQPFYSAANHFLDVFAHYRQAQGLTATAINWGPWSEGGMLTEDNMSQLAAMGIWGFSLQESLETLEQLITSGAAQRIAVKVDWRIFKDLFETRGRRPVLDMMVATEKEETAVAESMALTSFAEELIAGRKDSGTARLLVLLHQEVASVLGFSDVSDLPKDHGFFEMGLDSLMAIELKNRLQSALGLPLKTTVAFNYPNAPALASFLFEELSTQSSESTPTKRIADKIRDTSILEIDQATKELTDEELLSLLEKELES